MIRFREDVLASVVGSLPVISHQEAEDLGYEGVIVSSGYTKPRKPPHDLLERAKAVTLMTVKDWGEDGFLWVDARYWFDKRNGGAMSKFVSGIKIRRSDEDSDDWWEVLSGDTKIGEVFYYKETGTGVYFTEFFGRGIFNGVDEGWIDGNFKSNIGAARCFAVMIEKELIKLVALARDLGIATDDGVSDEPA